MSATALTSIQEIIERSLFYAIIDEIVDKGYFPDIRDDVTYPDTDQGASDFADAVTAVIASKGYAIEIFSGASNESRGVKKVPRIVIDSGNFLPGALGGDPRRYFEDQGASYNALVTPPQTVDFYVNFHLISGSIEQARILNAIIALSVPRRGYIPWYNDGAKTLFARYLNYYDQSNTDEGIIEHVYAYEVPDAWDREDVEAYATIAKINEITLNTNVQKYMDRTWGVDSDPLVIT